MIRWTSRRSFAWTWLLAALCLSGSTHAADQPNLVFVIADDLTFRELGCYAGQAHTPRIDRLATEGMRFTRCFQTASMCSPTRHTIYTGLYPVKSGAYPNHTFAKDGTQSVCHALGNLGYRVALSGKRHIGPQEVFPFEYSGKKNPDMAAINTLMAESKQSNTPFCLFACSNEPHTPWNKGDAAAYPPEAVQLPPYHVDTPETRDAWSRYLAEITYFDGQVGEILDLLDTHGLAENTLVVVTTEQGNSMPFAKWTLYDAGLQTAMIARWPGVVEAGATTAAMVEVAKAAAGDADAADKVRRYQHRPAVELYDLSADPYEWHNLAATPEHAGTVARLKALLEAWMASQGDQGQATELAAHKHQRRGR